MRTAILLCLTIFLLYSCKAEKNARSTQDILVDSVFINNTQVLEGTTVDDISFAEVMVRIRFNLPVDTGNFNRDKISISHGDDNSWYHTFSEGADELTIKFRDSLRHYSLYRFSFDAGINAGGNFREGFVFNFVTALDTSLKFPVIHDDSLLTIVQKQTLRYFIEYAHSSGMARERFGSGDLVSSGGTGFGLMAIITGIERNLISRKDGFDHVNSIVGFLLGAERFHGAFPCWLNGTTGRVYPVSMTDNGGDIVATGFLMQGLLTVREYFKNGSDEEKTMCDTITGLWEDVEWDWYRKSGNSLVRYWSPVYNWDFDMQVSGWNDGLIAYVLAASSPTHPVPKEVYDEGWARNGTYPMINGETFYGIRLPLGEDYGGPLSHAHYSFLGLDPRKLSDRYASYWEQNVSHTLINYNYCVENPKRRKGFSPDCWGLTSSDIPNGYTINSPLNDLGVIAPTAALSSMPYTPAESMRALKYFYYVLGDRIWGDYGFMDAFSLSNLWYSDSYNAMNQGSIICMLENYRSALLWDLFMSNSEIKDGLTKLGFTY